MPELNRPVHEILEEARLLAAISVGQLWWAYLAIGGSASLTDVAGFLSGSLQPERDQYDFVAQALNDHFVDAGMDHRVPYSAEN